MKLFLVGLAVIATAYAALPSNDYLPPLEDTSAASPLDLQDLSDSSVLADDGYRYKTQRRIRYRHRRDVNELPSNEYLPPVEAEVAAPVVAEAPIAVEEPAQDSAVLADDGYRYKTVRRIRYRRRRDVNELPSNEYLPPVEAEVAAPVVAEAPIAVEEPAQDSAVLADDGYRYKTVRRIRYRRRRDVNELPSNEYLPPVEAEVAAPVVAEAPIAVEEPVQDTAVLADDGYQYKTVRRIRYRRRRDVNELPSNEYLPPVEAEVAAPVVAEAPIAVEEPAQDSAVLADDGYRYKTVRRIRYRRRRDVNELPSNEYLPPVEAEVAAPVVAEAPIAVEEPVQDTAVLADDGYQYKTVRRIRYRRRRDVNELPSNEYLPPVEAEVAAPVVAEAPIAVEEPVQDTAVLADDGYQYKTVRRIRYRRRRDVNELPSNEYLPPVEAEVAAPVIAEAPIAIEEPAQDTAVLADDGYRYKTVRRIRYRRRRDVNELPSNEYLPPVEAEVAAPVVAEAPIAVEEPVQDTAVLADDGYQYKTVRRIRYRRRRDVNELPSNEYLPPVEAEVAAPVVAEAPLAVEEPAQDTAVLADDGYQYKTVRRIRYRRRRDVNELPSNEYLPPVEAEVAAPVVAEAPIAIEEPVQDTAVLADDGYQYKTVKRIRYRRRRDVNELPSNEYLPPVEAEVAAPVVAEAPIAVEEPAQDTAVLADDGYRYKTVRRIRYRRRRDVNELPSNEYLPPVEAPVEAPVAIEAPVEDSAVLADDGYRYKTLRRIRYRYRH